MRLSAMHLSKKYFDVETGIQAINARLFNPVLYRVGLISCELGQGVALGAPPGSDTYVIRVIYNIAEYLAEHGPRFRLGQDGVTGVIMRVGRQNGRNAAGGAARVGSARVGHAKPTLRIT